MRVPVVVRQVSALREQVVVQRGAGRLPPRLQGIGQHHVLVDPGLQFQGDRSDRAGMVGVPQHRHRMTDAFDHVQQRLDGVGVQRTGPAGQDGTPQQVGIQVERHRQGVALLMHQQRLARQRGSALPTSRRLRIVADEVADAIGQRQVVVMLQRPLHSLNQRQAFRRIRGAAVGWRHQ